MTCFKLTTCCSIFLISKLYILELATKFSLQYFCSYRFDHWVRNEGGYINPTLWRFLCCFAMLTCFICKTSFVFLVSDVSCDIVDFYRALCFSVWFIFLDIIFFFKNMFKKSSNEFRLVFHALETFKYLILNFKLFFYSGIESRTKTTYFTAVLVLNCWKINALLQVKFFNYYNI